MTLQATTPDERGQMHELLRIIRTPAEPNRAESDGRWRTGQARMRARFGDMAAHLEQWARETVAREGEEGRFGPPKTSPPVPGPPIAE